MKAITIHVSEPMYRAFQEFARLRGRKTAELIREAMDAYWEARIGSETDLNDSHPSTVGRIKKNVRGDEDRLEEMITYGKRERR